MERDHEILFAREMIVERAFGKIHPRQYVVHRESRWATSREDLTRDFQYGSLTLRNLRLFSCNQCSYGDKSSESN